MHITSQIVSNAPTESPKANAPATISGLFKDAFATASQVKSQNADRSGREQEPVKKSDRTRSASDQTTIPAPPLPALTMPVPVAPSPSPLESGDVTSTQVMPVEQSGSSASTNQNAAFTLASLSPEQQSQPDNSTVAAGTPGLQPIAATPAPSDNSQQDDSTPRTTPDLPADVTGSSSASTASVATPGSADRTQAAANKSHLENLSPKSHLAFASRSLSSSDASAPQSATHQTSQPAIDSSPQMTPVTASQAPLNSAPHAPADTLSKLSSNSSSQARPADAPIADPSAAAAAVTPNGPLQPVTNQTSVQPLPDALPLSAILPEGAGELSMNSPLGANEIVSGMKPLTGSPSASAPAAVKQSGTPGAAHAPVSEIAGKRKVDESATGLEETTSPAASSTLPVDTPPQASHNQPTPYQDQALQQAIQAAVSVPLPAVHASPQNMSSASTLSADPSASQASVAAKAEPVAVPALSSAQLIQSMHGSEMRLGMNSTEFGSLSINTSLSHQVLSAQISTDHAELSRALALHMPVIQERLGSAYGVQAKVEVHTNSFTSQGETSKQSDSRQSESHQARSASPVFNSRSLFATSAAVPNSSAVVASSDARLDIRI